MSKHRNETQKARRAYLDKCRKEGKKPLGMDAWKAEVEKVLSTAKKDLAKAKAKTEPKKPVKKPCAKKAVAAKKPAKTAKRPKVHEVHKGDVIKFVDFDPRRIMRYALRLLCMATNEVCK